MRNILIGLMILLLNLPCICLAVDTIKIGFNIPLTGDIPDVGESSKNAAEMLKAKINGAGGLEVGGKKYHLEFTYEDNESKAESALTVANKLIAQDGVLAIIGPQSSKQAVPAGEICNNLETPMISPWSTNPNTTRDRPYVFRGCFCDPCQIPAVANFVTEEFGAKKAAVLFDIASDYPKGLAEFFKAAFEKIHGRDSVVAFETFTTKDQDFRAQLTNIIKSEADVLFVPQYYYEVPLIVKQAKQLGWTKPIMGADAGAGGDLMSLCGDDCKGLYFSTHYSNVGATGVNKEFIDNYEKQFTKPPDDVAGLTWDSINVVLEAIKKTGGLTGDLKKDRTAVMEQMGTIKNFPGITGTMSFYPDGTPEKSVVIVRISNGGLYEFYKYADCVICTPHPWP